MSEAFADAPGGLCVFGVGLWCAHGLEEGLTEGVMESKTWLEPAGLSQVLITCLSRCLVTFGTSGLLITAHLAQDGHGTGALGMFMPHQRMGTQRAPPSRILVFLVSPVPPSSKVVDQGEVWSFTKNLMGLWRD